jgi:hypothetical protein
MMAEAGLRALKSVTVSEGTIQTFIQQRGIGLDGQPDTPDSHDCLWTNQPTALQEIADCLGTGDQQTANSLVGDLSFQSSVFSIQVVGWITQPSLRYRVEAVVERTAADKPPKVLAWREE